MKTTQQRFIIMILLIYAFSFSSYGQQVERTITLICDTDQLKNAKPKDAYKFCHFQGQTESDSRDYTASGDIEDTFIWEGKASSGSGKLKITKIKYERGTKVFSKDSIQGTQTVRAVAKHSTKGKDPYKYIIYFKLNKKKKYFIDPKLKIGE